MAHPAAQKVNPPQTLPADFFDKQQGGPPETLPADFDFGEHKEAAPPPPPEQKRGLMSSFLHGLTDPIMHPQLTTAQQGEGVVASGMAPGGMYPTTAATGRKEDSEANNQMQMSAQADQGDAAKSMAANPGNTAAGMAGNLTLAALTGGLLKGGEMGIEAFPTKAKAGAMLNEVSRATNGLPVNLTRTLPELENAQRLSSWGHGTITPLDSLYNRINTVNPIDFEEARGRYRPLTRLTANDKMSATKQLQAAAKKTAHSMREDIGDTADQVGMRDTYDRGMDMYHNASRIDEFVKRARKAAIPAAAGALGIGAAHNLYTRMAK